MPKDVLSILDTRMMFSCSIIYVKMGPLQTKHSLMMSQRNVRPSATVLPMHISTSERQKRPFRMYRMWQRLPCYMPKQDGQMQ